MKQITANTAGLPLFEQPANRTTVNVQEIIDQARVLRSQAFADTFNAIGRAVKAYFSKARTARTLNNLSDAVLMDIGIERDQIPSICSALADGSYVSQTPSVPLTQTARSDAQDHDDHQAELPLAA